MDNDPYNYIRHSLCLWNDGLVKITTFANSGQMRNRQFVLNLKQMKSNNQFPSFEDFATRGLLLMAAVR